jgi:eukaryotic-like serine/threonine-protein kinase
MPEAHQQQRYRVIEKLASGGMAEVFRAESAGLEGFKKQVAIKRVLPHLSEKKKFISMFLDEARLSAHLSHSNCVQVFDIGVGDNAYFIVMEYVDGSDLKAVLETLRKRGRSVAVEEAVFICIKICEGLCYAHELADGDGKQFGVVHRDVSPPNVLITKHGEIKIVDFGLAKASSQLERSEPGIIKGKFSYLSPEAALGKEVDPRTDIFAVGIILWEMLSGRRLFLGDTDFATVKLVQQAMVPSLSRINPKVPMDLEVIINKALARDPAQRHQSAREFAVALNEFLYRQGRPVGSFSIESLVLSTIKERQRGRPLQHSIIDKLIEEALFEFTSLQEAADVGPKSKGSGAPDAGSAPLSLEKFNQGHDWAREIAIRDTDSQRDSALPPRMVEAGNLAALEEDEGDGGSGYVDEPDTSEPSEVGGSMRPAPIAPAADRTGMNMAAPIVKKGSGGAVAFVVVLVLLVVLAGAYYTGLFPGVSPPH